MTDNKLEGFKLRFTERQLEQLRQKAAESGFKSIAVYIRYHIFFTVPLLEKAFRKVKE
ncbi:MAG: hypothetical protein WC254_04810 [Candidatus Woesearchaeota archaeon]|jgi:hypothetical protein